MNISVAIEDPNGLPLRQHTFAGAGTFVVAQPGKTFTVRVTTGSSETIATRLYIDGVDTGWKTNVTKRHVFKGWQQPGGQSLRQFVFAAPPTVEDASMLPAGAANQLDSLGEIKLIAWRTVPGDPKKQGKKRAPPKGVAHVQQAVPEGKKVLAVGVTTAAGAIMPHAPHPFSSRKRDKKGGPIATITLRYCVPDALALSPIDSLKKVGESASASGTQ